MYTNNIQYVSHAEVCVDSVLFSLLRNHYIYLFINFAAVGFQGSAHAGSERGH